MAEFVDLNAGDPILASDLNKLADDIGDGTLGHQHSGGTDGHATLKPDAIGDGASITIDGRFLFDKGGDLASGSAITPGTDGNYFDITGTTTITSIATLQAGAVVIFQFDDSLTLTHNGTSLILQDAANHITLAGDHFAFISLGSGNWKELWRNLATAEVGNLSSTITQESRSGASASGDVSYTGAGFTPTTVLGFARDNASGDGFSFGFGDDALLESMFSLVDVTGTPFVLHETADIVGVFAEAAKTNGQSAVLKTLDADGVTLTWTKAGSGLDLLVTFLYMR